MSEQDAGRGASSRKHEGLPGQRRDATSEVQTPAPLIEKPRYHADDFVTLEARIDKKGVGHARYPSSLDALSALRRVHEQLQSLQVEQEELRRENTRMREALERIAQGPYNGFEECRAIARTALATGEEE